MISKPWVSSAVAISPSPWFHSCVTVLAKVASSPSADDAYVVGSSHTVPSSVSK